MVVLLVRQEFVHEILAGAADEQPSWATQYNCHPLVLPSREHVAAPVLQLLFAIQLGECVAALVLQLFAILLGEHVATPVL